MLQSSLNGLIGLALLLSSPPTQEQLGWPIPALDAAALQSYADIEAALESRLLIPLGMPWSFFPGSAEPSPGLEWVRADFDDALWQRGASPFVYGGGQEGAGGTWVEAFGEGVSTLYLRCKFNLPNPELYTGIWLEMLVDDGYILYLNKVEERRLAAGDPEKPQAFTATASSARDLDERPMPRFDLTRPIKTGINQIAVQALVFDGDRESFGFYPSVRGIYRSTPESEVAHYAELKALIEDSGGAHRAQQLLFLEARHRERLGHFAEAIPFYRQLVATDPNAHLAFERMLECHRALGSLEAMESWLRSGVLDASAAPLGLDAWASLWLEELRWPLEKLAALVPAGLDTASAPQLDDALWSARKLAANRVLRINAGAHKDLELDGVAWSRDRFGVPALVSAAAEGLLEVGRGTQRDLDSLRDMYRIPLWNGTYSVRLWGTLQAAQAVDVYLEGTRHREQRLSLQRNAGSHYVAQVRDGFLDLDVSGEAGQATLGALELRLLGTDEALDLVRERHAVGASNSPSALESVQLAEAEWAAGNKLLALQAFERAEQEPSFNLEQRARLSELRDALLPAIASQASARDLAQRHGARWERMFEEAEQAEDSDASAVMYFGGLCQRAAGQPGEAIGYFEQLVFDRCPEPGPYIGMALCLLSSELPEDAAEILELALKNGLRAEGALLQTWISVQLGGLGRDPWELVDQMAKMNVPPKLVLVPTSEEFGLPWRYTHLEPSATTWSRPSFGIEHWDSGLGPIGAGHPQAGYPRALWNRIMLFARTSFELDAPNLLYPFLRVYGRGSNDTYLNGIRVARHLLASDGYRQLPLRAPSVSGSATTALSTGLMQGTNLLGMFGYNTRGPGMLDVGIEQDFETLFWIRDQLQREGALRFNCGGEDLTLADGRRFHGDRFYNWAVPGSLSSAEPNQDIANTEDDELYRTTRRFYNDSVSAWYEIPLPDGEYRVVLHFAELSAKYQAPGARSFDVTIEEVRQLSAFDVAAEAGFMGALVKEFEVKVEDGWMDIKLAHKEHFSFLNALEIIAK